ncbi:MAG: hypothetical protein COB66_06850 [Coxiella sp. (in: Bacteria)]|nr:MAG: hypothetical protein COB66_06850 [Coxiella sp. (in: g-proteobacteria)]
MSALRYARAQKVIASVIDGELLVLNADTDCFRLSDIAADIWHSLAQTKSFAQIRDGIMRDYDVPRSVCEPDLHVFMSQLQESGLIEQQR